MKQHHLIGIILLNLAFSPLSFAKHHDHDNKPNDCERLHIQIGNATNSSCYLIKSNLIHGNYMSSAPASIMPGASDRFDLKQTVYGPDIELEYKCNDRTIKFKSQQNYCFWKAGQVTGKVLSAHHMSANYHAENGSYAWGQPGTISWVLNN